MIFEASVDELVFQFSAQNEEARPIVLLGAGASISSGIPSAHMSTIEIVKWAYAREILKTTPDRVNIRKSEWERYLQQQPWYRKEDSYAELYPDAVEKLLVPREFRRQVLTAILKDKCQPSKGYNALADLCQRHLVYHFLTTNFDPLLEESLLQKRPHIREVTTVNKTAGDFEAFSPHRKAQLIYLHGTVENYSDKNLSSETLELESNLVDRIHSLVEYAPIVVVGYRGNENSVMKGLFDAALERSGNFRRGIFWCIRGDEEPHENVNALHEKVGSNLRVVRIKGFDELFVDINKQLKGQSLNPKESIPAPVGGSSKQFDSEPLFDKSFDDLDQVSLKSRLSEHQKRVGNSEIEDFDQFLLEYQFAEKHDDRLVPTRGLWWLFGNGESVTSEQPHLKSVLKIGAKKQTVLDGNLIEQFEALKILLNSPDFNPDIRVKSEKQSLEQKAYHARALLELLVNHFVHRDYSIEEPSEIHCVPGESISFSTVGSLPVTISTRLDRDDEGFFRPQLGVKEHRNPLLADVFYGMNYMDGEGSGLTDVERFAAEYHGKVTFQEKAQRVISRLSQAEQDKSGKSRTATPKNKKRIFMTNLMEIRDLPQCIYRLPLLPDCDKVKTAFSKPGVEYSSLPLFMLDGGMAISFSDWNTVASQTGRFGYVEYMDQLPVSDWIKDEDKRRLIVGLLRKEFERYLWQFKDSGMIVDRKKSRAYFTPANNNGRIVRWNSASRKGIKRGVVKRRGDHNYENEGISYSIQQFGDIWAIQIKPIYVFTKNDGKTPVPGIEQTKKATKRYKFDRNNSVASDLSFWTAFLAQGKSLIDISSFDATTIIVNCQLSEAECVQETSL